MLHAYPFEALKIEKRITIAQHKAILSEKLAYPEDVAQQNINSHPKLAYPKYRSQQISKNNIKVGVLQQRDATNRNNSSKVGAMIHNPISVTKVPLAYSR